MFLQLHKNSSRLLLAALCCASCLNGVRWHTYQSVPAAGWGRTDTMSFTLPEWRDSSMLHLHLCLRVRSNARWSSLPVVFEYRLSHPDTVYRDTFVIPFQKPSPLPLPFRGSTTLIQCEQPLASLNASRLCPATIRLFHLMPIETVPFVTDVGLRIEGE